MGNPMRRILQDVYKRQAHFIDSVRECNGGNILPDFDETIGISELVAVPHRIPSLASGHDIQFRVEKIRKIHGTAEKGVSMDGLYSHSGAH